MYCSQCGKKLRENAAFCSQCGTKAGAAVNKARLILMKKPIIWLIIVFVFVIMLTYVFVNLRATGIKSIKFYSVDLDSQIKLGTPISFSGNNSLPNELQWLAVHIACIGIYNNAQAGNYTLGDPTDHYKPSDIRDFLTARSDNETKTDMFYGICFNYAQAAYDDIIHNQNHYQKLGVRQWYIAGVLDDPAQIILYDPVSRAEANTIMNGVYVREASRLNVRAHSNATWHAWLWVYGNDGEIYWIDPTWTDNTGYVVWGIVRNGEEIQLNPLESLNKVKINPASDAFAWANRGNGNKNNSNYEQSIEDYTAVLQINPNDTNAYINRGIAYAASGNFNTAIEDFNQAIRLSMDLSIAYTLRGRALFASVVTVTEIEENFSNFYFQDEQPITTEQKQAFERALADFNWAMQLAPNDAANYYERARIYAMKEEYNLAIRDYTQVLILDPNNVDVYKNRGFSYFKIDDFDRAIADYNQHIIFATTDPIRYYYRGSVYFFKGDYDQAIADANQALMLNPNNDFEYFCVYLLRCSAFNEKGGYDQVITDTTLMINLDISDEYRAIAYFMRGAVYYSKGNYDNSIANLLQAIRLDPNNAEYQGHIEQVRRLRGY